MTKKKKNKEFFLTSWAINNRTAVYVLAVFISILGIMSYNSIPKEQFPEIVIPTIMVNTIYPGTSPTDIENLITRPIEKQIKSIAGVKKISSNSIQDFSLIFVEFNTDVDVAQAKQKVKDAVDKAKSNLPNNLLKDPDVKDIDFSEFPIMSINISGDYNLDKLKSFAEQIQDRIETLKEITRVDIVGALEREIQIDVDMNKMQSASVTFTDIERAVSSENVTVSAGNIDVYGMNRSVRIVGQFNGADDLYNIVFKSSSGATIYLKDIATIKDSYKEQENFSRLNGKNVITCNVIKKSGQNLLEAADQIKLIITDLKENSFPDDLKITITGDQSTFTKNTLTDLNNTIVIGFILVILVLMFFIGFKNSFFVGLSAPLSMFIAYLIMPGIGFTMNMIVMFAFIFALGIIVDDAIVVIENTHRWLKQEKSVANAARFGAGEVFLPVLSGTLTVLAPFFPLAFWPGIVGSFMKFLPITLIITLFASLVVAYLFNPVFAASFMKHDDMEVKKTPLKAIGITSLVMITLGILFHLGSMTAIGNFMFFAVALYLLFQFVLKAAIHGFQSRLWPAVMRGYERSLRFVLHKRNAYYTLSATVGLLFLTFFLMSIFKPKVVFFPDNEPKYVNILMTLPVGTNQNVTDSLAREVEKKIYGVIGYNNPIIESVITNITRGADDEGFDRFDATNKGKVTVNFVEFKDRIGVSTSDYLKKITEAVKGIPGANIVVNKNRMGPPTGKPINVEVSGENMDEIIEDATRFKKYIDSLQIPGMQEMKSDFQANKPEIVINIDRKRALQEGIYTGQGGMEIRTAIFGKEISKLKEGEDEFPILLRYDEKTRSNIDDLMNLKIVFRDMVTGMLRQIPLSTVAKVEYSTTYGSVKRQNMKRVITLTSEVVEGYNANEIMAKIQTEAVNFKTHSGVSIGLTGESEFQKESMNFLMRAMIIAVFLMFFILISQFNSISKTLIILSEVVFSVIGVFLGIMIFGMSISIVMTGIGIVALGGIVVRNGILIVEFIDVMKSRGLKTTEAIVEGSMTRVTPVVLTAMATMLGLVPLAIGMNIDFIGLLTDFNPHLHFGGDNVMFFGPLSWTIIFGLSFSTFLTLIVVPAMYYIAYTTKVRVKRGKSNRAGRKLVKVRETLHV
ncbi:MAG: efflux RND transporter permease subunit [Bacteroidota bacterium]